MDVRIPLLWRRAKKERKKERKERWPQVITLTCGVRNIHVSAENRSYRESLYTLERSERKAEDESENTL